MALSCLVAAAEVGAATCPSRLDRATREQAGTCTYVGRACGAQAVAVFAADGRAVVVKLELAPPLPPVFIAAQALSASEGRLVLWRQDLDLAGAATIGTVRLDGDGRRLELRLEPGILSVQGCGVREFVGRLPAVIPTAHVDGSAGGSGRRGRRGARVQPAASLR